MRELHGVMEARENSLVSLKRKALLFDKLHLIRMGDRLDDAISADLSFLSERGYILEPIVDDLFREPFPQFVSRNSSRSSGPISQITRLFRRT